MFRIHSLLLLLFLCVPASSQELGNSIGQFGFHYFQELDTEENTVVSPLSIHAAFSLLSLGADGATRSEADQVLFLNDDTYRQYASFVKDITPKRGHLSLASRLWPSNSLKLKKNYLEQSLEFFDASPQNLDYGKPEAARKLINAWVSKKTSEQIPKLLPPGAIGPDTLLTLCNALYFEGQWAEAFHARDTRDGAFHTYDGDVDVPMMNAKMNRPNFVVNDKYVSLGLSYHDSTLAMAFIMPTQQKYWSSTKAQLGTKMLNALEQSRVSEEGSVGLNKVVVSLPKFKIRQKTKPLPLLRKIGLELLTGSNADLSKLTSAPGVAVGDCFHEAVVEIDEKGTKASAATAIILLRSQPRILQTITIDRPFFFVIYETRSLAPLFIGAVRNPAQE